jgi:uncharacterized protein
MKKVFIAMLVLGAVFLQARAVKKVVYQCDFQDPKRVHYMLNTLENLMTHYQNEKEEFDIKVVVSGGCLEHVVADFHKTKLKDDHHVYDEVTLHGEMIIGTHTHLKNVWKKAGVGLEVLTCSNTMKRKNVMSKALMEGIEVVPSGVVTVVELQHKGYAYIKAR